MRTVLKAMLLVSLAAICSAQTDWQPYRNTDGNFSALMPTTPSEIYTHDFDSGTTHTIRSVDQGAGFMVVYEKAKGEHTVDQASYDAYERGVLQSLGECKIEDKAGASLAVPNTIGAWYRMDCTVGQTPMYLVGNLYWGKHYAYAVMVAYPHSSAIPPIDKFVNSFGLIDTSL